MFNFWRIRHIEILVGHLVRLLISSSIFFIVVFWRIRKKMIFFLLTTKYWVLFLFSDLRNNDDNDEVIHFVFLFLFLSHSTETSSSQSFDNMSSPHTYTCFFLVFLWGGWVDQKIIMMSPPPGLRRGVKKKYCFYGSHF